MSKPHRRWLVPAALVAAIATGQLAFAAQASAHDVLKSTVPADKSTVATTPTQVQLTFDQPAFPVGSQVLVNGPNGNVATGPVHIVNRVVSQELSGGAPAGEYTVLWRVTSADGHPVSGQFTFTSEAASAPRAGSAVSPGARSTGAAPKGSSSRQWWLALVAALVIGWVLAVLALRRRRVAGGDGSAGRTH